MDPPVRMAKVWGDHSGSRPRPSSSSCASQSSFLCGCTDSVTIQPPLLEAYDLSIRMSLEENLQGLPHRWIFFTASRNVGSSFGSRSRENGCGFQPSGSAQAPVEESTSGRCTG